MPARVVAFGICPGAHVGRGTSVLHSRDVDELEPERPSPWRQDLPAHHPPRAPAPGHRIGRAAGVTTRVEGLGRETTSSTVLGFRLVDPVTSALAEVELRGRSIAGTVQDGDWVEVADRPSRSGRLEPAHVLNLTTGSEVAAIGSRRGPLARVLAVLFVLVFLLVLAVIAYGVVSTLGEPGF